VKLSKFLDLVRGGEKAHVDFKLTCNAFNSSAGDSEQAKAELVKDICAMANNGPMASFLIVGVSNDRKQVRAANDLGLTSENIQSLIRESIHPRPVVRIYSVKWEDAPAPFANTDFMVIQVGPNAREAFRLTRDIINYAKKMHFRRHEVWVRNEETTDLATPEQIVRLMGVRRRAQAEPTPGYVVAEYLKLPKGQAIHAMSRDAREFFTELGIEVGPVKEPEIGWLGGGAQFRIRAIVRGKVFVFRCVFADELTSPKHLMFFDPRWSGEHGLLVFLNGRYAEGGKFRRLRVDFRTEWGAFALIDLGASNRFTSFLPSGFADVFVGSLTAPNLNDTQRLRERTAAILKSLENDDQLFGYLETSRDRLTKELVKWSARPDSKLKAAFAEKRNETAFKEFVGEANAVLELAKARRS
jgi:Putative DNA-binding domain